jgi:hypothetical protein
VSAVLLSVSERVAFSCDGDHTRSHPHRGENAPPGLWLKPRALVETSRCLRGDVHTNIVERALLSFEARHHGHMAQD